MAFIAHNSKCSHFFRFVQSARTLGRLAIGRLTWRKRSRTISARSRSRSSAESFQCVVFVNAPLCQNEQFISQRRSTPGNNPISTPNLIKESRSWFPSRDILCAFARIRMRDQYGCKPFWASSRATSSSVQSNDMARLQERSWRD